MSEPGKSQRSKHASWPAWLTPILVLVLIAVPVGLWWYLGWWPAQRAWTSSPRAGRSASEKFGTYGDAFGAVNSLASTLALGGVAIALLLQWREQHDARREAEEARRNEATRLDAEHRRDLDSKRHEAELAMTAALISAHAAMMNYRIENYRHTNDKLLNHRDKINVQEYGKVLNEQAHKLLETYASIERLARIAEEKLGLKIETMGSDPMMS